MDGGTIMRPLVAALLVLFAAPAPGQDMEYGQAEFMNSCAVCHGEDGRGEGPLSEELRTPPADLTRLTEANGGEFPYWKVFTTIDGRHLVPGHGPSDMPVWGRHFLDQDRADFGEIGGEAVTQERIHALTEYIADLQR